MSVTDGAILFFSCVTAFVVGYWIGAARVAKVVRNKLDEVSVNLENIQKHSRQLQQVYAKLHGTEEETPR